MPVLRSVRGHSVFPIRQKNGQQPLQFRLLLGSQGRQVRTVGSPVVEEMSALHQQPQGAAGHFPAGFSAVLRLQSKMFAALSALQGVNGALVFTLVTMLFLHEIHPFILLGALIITHECYFVKVP